MQRQRRGEQPGGSSSALTGRGRGHSGGGGGEWGLGGLGGVQLSGS